jgi:hypothetical protein
MRGLATLLRLARGRSEDLRANLVAATHEREAAAAELSSHDAATRAEDSAADGDATVLADWAAWAATATRERQALARATELLAIREAEARDQVREGLAEAKRLELALEAAEQAARSLARRRIQLAAEETELRRLKA